MHACQCRCRYCIPVLLPDTLFSLPLPFTCPPGAVLGRDVTDRLLVDDESLEAGEPQGPLADLKRQMRMLSQNSPVLAPGAEQAAAVAAAAAEEQAAVVPVAAAGGEAAPPAKTPRAALSLGYADSHNPATLRLLRSGGTTRLLAETGSLGGEGEEEEDGMEGLEEALAGGAPHGAGAGASGDNAATARTGGTTKLLADMTMASSVGAKLLGRGAQGEHWLPLLLLPLLLLLLLPAGRWMGVVGRGLCCRVVQLAGPPPACTHLALPATPVDASAHLPAIQSRTPARRHTRAAAARPRRR